MEERTKKSILIEVRGGVGKNFSLAHIIDEIKEAYPEGVKIVTPYFDIFESIEGIDVYNASQPGIWKSVFEDIDDDTKIVIDHMYETEEFIRKEINYQDAWRKLCDIPIKNSSMNIIETNKLEPEKKYKFLVNQVQAIQEELQKKGYQDFIIFQHTGGQSPLVQVPVDKEGKQHWESVPYNGQNNGLSRHYPEDYAYKFVTEFKQKHPNTAVISFTLPNEPFIEGTEKFQVPYLAYHLLARQPNCKGFVSVDSCLQHMITGLVKGVVIWGHSAPTVFGYSNNENIVQKCNRENIHYFTQLGPAFNKIKYIDPELLEKQVEKILFEDTK